MRLIPFFLFLILFLPQQLHAQDAERSTIKSPLFGDSSDKGQGFSLDRVVVGGNLGLQFGTITIIDVSPLVGYRVTDEVLAGVGATYKYYNRSDFTPDLETSIYGGSVFARYYLTFLLEGAFAHAEYELLSFERSTDADRESFNSVLVGGGYNYSLGGVTGVNVMVLWNLNDSDFSPYENPIIRGGFIVGF